MKPETCRTNVKKAGRFHTLFSALLLASLASGCATHRLPTTCTAERDFRPVIEKLDSSIRQFELVVLEDELKSRGATLDESTLAFAYKYIAAEIELSQVPELIRGSIEEYAAVSYRSRGPRLRQRKIQPVEKVNGYRSRVFHDESSLAAPMMDWRSYTRNRLGVFREYLAAIDSSNFELLIIGMKSPHALAVAKSHGFSEAYELVALDLTKGKDIFILFDPPNCRHGILFANIKGNYYFDHQVLLARFLLKDSAVRATVRAILPPANTVESQAEIRQSGIDFGDYVSSNTKNAIEIGYAPQFRAELGKTLKQTGSKKFGQFLIEEFSDSKSDGRRIYVVASSSSYYGDIITAFVDGALSTRKFDKVFFTGSAGGLRDGLTLYQAVHGGPYLTYSPTGMSAQITVDEGPAINKAGITFGISHGNSKSPLEQTRQFLDRQAAATVDVEAVLLAEICRQHSVEFRSIVLVTDFPKRPGEHNIDRQDPTKKVHGKLLIAQAITPWLITTELGN